MEPIRPREGTTVAGRFRLVRKLGQGGMGAVWLAHHVALDTACAIKFIHGDVARHPEARGRFEREAKAIAQIRSPHVVNVLDFGTHEGCPYLAMELLEGEDLAQRLKRVGRLSPQATANIVGQIARALGKAHALGLVHRDLKPENVFLVRDEDREIVKVLDFGIAKGGHALDHGSTQTGAVLGTPTYMSPEQAQGNKALDHRSDLWSLGVLSFVCLVGRAPFRGESFAELLLQICASPLPVPSEEAPDLTPQFDAWFAKACAQNPSARFQSAKELAEGLAEALQVVPMSSDARASDPARLALAATIAADPAEFLSSAGPVGVTTRPPPHDLARVPPTIADPGASHGGPSIVGVASRTLGGAQSRTASRAAMGTAFGALLVGAALALAVHRPMAGNASSPSAQNDAAPLEAATATAPIASAKPPSGDAIPTPESPPATSIPSAKAPSHSLPSPRKPLPQKAPTPAKTYDPAI